MSRVQGNFVDSVEREMPWPAHEVEGDSDSADEPKGEKQVAAKFWAHDSEAMMEMDRQALQEALDGNTEIGRLEKLRDSDFETYVRSGGADRLLSLTVGRK